MSQYVFCPNCNHPLVHSSTSYGPTGETHALGCIRCKGLWDVNNQGRILKRLVRPETKHKAVIPALPERCTKTLELPL